MLFYSLIMSPVSLVFHTLVKVNFYTTFDIANILSPKKSPKKFTPTGNTRLLKLLDNRLYINMLGPDIFLKLFLLNEFNVQLTLVR